MVLVGREFRPLTIKIQRVALTTEIRGSINSWLGSLESKPNNPFIVIVFGRNTRIVDGVSNVTASLAGISSMKGAGSASNNAGYLVPPNV